MWFRMWFVCTLIDNDMRHNSGRNVVDSRGTAEWVHIKFWPLSIFFDHCVFYHNINVKENGFFFRAWLRAWHIDASSVVWTLLDNNKLANEIARLVAIVAKYLLGKENCELWGTDDFQGQKCEHIFAPNGGYCLSVVSSQNSDWSSSITVF